jgi:3-methyladenine DNA glycosylase AlkC
MVMALINSANDDNGQVRNSLARSLQDIGKKQPNLVLVSCYDFMVKNQKVENHYFYV